MKVADYLDLPYHISIVRDEDEEHDAAWIASVDELPGCISQGDSPEEATTMIREAMQAWIEVSLDHGDTIPKPRRLDSYSGQFVLRLPSGLHQQLDVRARQEGVSLNQLVATLLAGALGWSTPGARPVQTSTQARKRPARTTRV